MRDRNSYEDLARNDRNFKFTAPMHVLVGFESTSIPLGSFLSPHPEEPCHSASQTRVNALVAWRLEGRGWAWSPWPSFEARPRGRAPQDEVAVWCTLHRM